jgi:hypothetical protein
MALNNKKEVELFQTGFDKQKSINLKSEIQTKKKK